MIWGDLVGPAVVTAVVNGLVWMGIQRREQRRDQEVDGLRNDVRNLRDMRIGGIERQIAAHEVADEKRSDAASKSRREIYGDLEAVRLEYVRRDDCVRIHKTLSEQMTAFGASVLRLEAVNERVNLALTTTQRLTDQLISVQQDVSALCARVEERKHAG